MGLSIYAQAWVYANSKARLADRLVLLAIADEADDDGTNAYPSQRRIADKALVSQSTVRRSIESLEAMGELGVVRPVKTGRGKFNVYTVLMGRTAEDAPVQEGAQIEHLSVVRDAKERAETSRPESPMGGANPLTPLPEDQETSARSRNLHFDAIQEAWPTAKPSFVMKTLTTIKRVSPDVTPGDIAGRIAYMRTLEWGANASMQALADHWSELRALPPVPAGSIRRECQACYTRWALPKSPYCEEHDERDVCWLCQCHTLSPDQSGVCADPDHRAEHGLDPLDIVNDG